MTTTPDTTTPTELRPIEAALDRLARAERSAAPAGLEDRIARASLTRLHGSAGPISIVPHLAARWMPLAAAAGIVLCGGLAMLVASRMNTPQPQNRTAPTVLAASLEEDVEFWLSLRTPDEFQSVADRIDLLTVDTDTMAPPEPGELFDLLDTDAM